MGASRTIPFNLLLYCLTCFSQTGSKPGLDIYQSKKKNAIIWLGHRVALIWQSWMDQVPSSILRYGNMFHTVLFHLSFCTNNRNSTNAIALSNILLYLRLLVVLHSHGNDIQSNHACDEQIQIMGGAHLVDQKSEARVIRVVGFTLCFWKRGERKQIR